MQPTTSAPLPRVLAGAAARSKDGLQRLLVQIPLTDTAQAAVEGDSTAIDRLLTRLAGIPTPHDGGTSSTAISPEALKEDAR
jgi:hypothetical protein